MKRRIINITMGVVIMSSLMLGACGGSTAGPETAAETSATETAETAPGEVTETAAATEQSEEAPETQAEAQPETTNADDTQFSINLEGVSTLEDLETRIEEHLAGCIASLNARAEALRKEIDSYDKYCSEKDKVSAFYATVEEETDAMCIMLREYSAAYARMILDSDMSDEDKYRAVDGINDCIYDDACDEINDKIYEGLMDDMNDHFYEGVLKDGEDTVEYSEWYDVCSDEYSQWYDTASEVYSTYYDASSDIYSFYHDMSGELYSGDLDRAEKIYSRFIEKIEKKKNTGNAAEGTSDAVFDTTLRDAATTEELEDVVEAHVSECIQALNKEWSDLSAKTDTYDKYTENAEEVEHFHKHIEDATDQILQMISGYGVIYADLIMASDSSDKDKYNAMEDLRDCIYDDACDMVKDDIYEELLGNVKDYYYEGIIKDAKDAIEYKEWSNARSDAYDWWSDARGEVYDSWSDTRADLYDFCSDVRSELYSGDIDKANKEIRKFEKSLGTAEAARANAADDTTKAAEETETAAEAETAAETEAPADTESSSDIRPEFKAAMDEYEAFYDQYCDFMKKYKENPSDLELAKESLDMYAKLGDMQESFDAWEDKDLNDAELKYYLEVTTRIEQKLIDVM